MLSTQSGREHKHQKLSSALNYSSAEIQLIQFNFHRVHVIYVFICELICKRVQLFNRI